MIGTGNYEEATASLIYSLRHMEKIAQILGEEEDSAFYGRCAAQSTTAYLEYFLPEGTVHSPRMCKYVRPLALGLLDDRPDIRRKVQQGLIDLVQSNGYHVGTGFLSTPFLLNTLTDAGSPESAYRMLLQEEFPSWVYEIRCGATTVWEDWDGVSSRNHYSNGAVCDWVFNTVCGVRVTGENRFTHHPTHSRRGPDPRETALHFPLRPGAQRLGAAGRHRHLHRPAAGGLHRHPPSARRRTARAVRQPDLCLPRPGPPGPSVTFHSV